MPGTNTYNTMRNLIIIMSLLLLVSCKDAALPSESGMEEQAKELLAQANSAYEAQDYTKAKILLDSIKRTYPRAFKVGCEREVLYNRVLVDEKKRDVEFLESEIERLSQLRDSLAKSFDYRKDSRYEDFAVYSHPSQAISKNAGNCFMRATVNEDAEAVITSFYRGNRIGYNRIKVSSGGVFVEVDVKNADRPWTGREYGVYVERYGFKLGNDGDIMKFIANAQGPIVVELSGNTSKYTYELRKEDANAIRKVLGLQRVLAAIKENREALDHARYALAYLGQGK